MERKYENANLTISTTDIANLSNDVCNSLECGDVVRKIDKNGKEHAYTVSSKESDKMCLVYADDEKVEKVKYEISDGKWAYDETETNEFSDLTKDCPKVYKVDDEQELTNDLFNKINLGDIIVSTFSKYSYVVNKKQLSPTTKIYAGSTDFMLDSPWVAQQVFEWQVGHSPSTYIKESEYKGSGLNRDICFYKINYKNSTGSLYLCEVQGITTGTPFNIYTLMKNTVEQTAQSLSIPINDITSLATLNTAVNTIYSALVGASQKSVALTLVSALALFDISAKVLGEDFVGAYETLQGYILSQTYQILLPWLFHYNAGTGLAEQTTLAGLLESVSTEERPIDEIEIQIPELVIE